MSGTDFSLCYRFIGNALGIEIETQTEVCATLVEVNGEY